jgi:hypothetical protein
MEGQALVNRLPGGIQKRQISGFTGPDLATTQGLYQGGEILPADPDNAHRTPAGGRGNGRNGVLMTRQ